MRRLVAGAVLAGWSVGATPLTAQSLDTAQVDVGGTLRDFVVQLAYLAVAPTPGTTTADLEALVPEGLTWVRTLPDRTHVFELSAGPSSRRELFDMGTQLAVTHPGQVLSAGLLAEESNILFLMRDEVILRYDAAATLAMIAVLETRLRLETLHTAPTDPRLKVVRSRHPDRPDAIELADQLLGSTIVARAYPRFAGGGAEAGSTRRDDYEADQWHLPTIEAAGAWPLVPEGSPATIAVIEWSGFEPTHPELIDKTGGTWYDCRNLCVLETSALAHRHGTAVAALAAAPEGVGKVVGVCPDCELVLIRASHDPWDMERAFELVRVLDADVVNASWNDRTQDPELEDEIVATVATGVTVVMANLDAGGWSSTGVCSGDTHETLSALPEVISVSVSNHSDELEPGYGTGDCLDLLAPGAPDIATADRTTGAGYNSVFTSGASPADFDDDRYTRYFEGSSASAPIVAGVVGLMLSSDPTLAPAEVREILIKTADKIECEIAAYSPDCTTDDAKSATHFYGRVNAKSALGMVNARKRPNLQDWAIIIDVMILIIMLIVGVRWPKPKQPPVPIPLQ